MPGFIYLVQIRSDLEDKALLKARKEADQQKDALLSALKAKFACGEKLDKADLIESCFTEMKKWEDMNTPKNGRYASADKTEWQLIEYQAKPS